MTNKDLLRFLTAGNVDDGKSTLIGRLLYEAGGVYEDQVESIRKRSAIRNTQFDVSLFTDGLKTEREQAITIDVAYRYFSTPKRKFIVADTPGHEQYTQNMVTGASTSELLVLLVDACKGIVDQTLRHAYIASLLGIRRFVIAVNKMDLVAFNEEVFQRMEQNFKQFNPMLGPVQEHFLPVSASEGENVTRPSKCMPWYRGPSLLEFLETVPVQESRNLEDFRFPIQGIIRPNQGRRSYAGQIVSGSVKVGQKLVALPSMQSTNVEEIRIGTAHLEQAFSPQSVAISLSNENDLGRGDMLVDPQRMPAISKYLIAKLVWMSPTPLRTNAVYLIRHTTQTVCGMVTAICNKTDIHTLRNVDADGLDRNEVGTVKIQTHKPVFCDRYEVNRNTGSFILIDPMMNNTVAAGMVINAFPMINIEEEEKRFFSASAQNTKCVQHFGLTVWLTGLSGSGKTTICKAVYTEMLARGFRVEMLDGDVLRKHLNRDLGFNKRDREENIHRISFVASLLTRNGILVLVSAISPYRAGRDEARRMIRNFLEAHIAAPLSVCEARDPKGLYRRARAGELELFTGIDDPYEPPVTPEILCETDRESVKESTDKVVDAILRFLSGKHDSLS